MSKETKASRPAGPPRDAVEILVEGVCKSFDDNRVLNGIDLEIRRGDFVAIVGGSGCGKTVLLNHMLSLLTPDAGRVLVADHDRPGAPLVDLAMLGDVEVDRIHTSFGVVFQKNALFSGTVYDNISLWLREVRNLDDEAILPIARAVLNAVALPADDDFLDTETESLSGGMAKRLAVARTLAMDPIAIFYDEPTTGLDPASAAQIQDLILATHSEPRPGRPARTTVIVTHDKDLLSRLQPRTVMVHEGRVFFDGPYDDFEASDSEIIRPYFELMPVLHQRAVAAP